MHQPIFRIYLPRFFFLIFVVLNVHLSAQVDTVYFVTGDYMLGEVKKMDKGVLVAETAYSDKDFQIEWSEVRSIRTQNQFMIDLSGGQKYYGRLFSLPDSTVQIMTMPFEPIVVHMDDILYFEAYDDRFKDRFSASIDLGYDLARARTLRKLNSTVKLGYHAEKWSSDLGVNILRSTQDESEDIQRTESDLTFRYLLTRKWYLIGTVTELSNTEQNLDIRMNGQLGMGRFIVRSKKLYWGAKVGVNRNLERYSNDTDDRESWEGILGTELNLYNMGDIDLLFMFMAYPGLTEKGRMRSDSKLDIKYDLPLDFYLKLGISVNYDNQPAEDAQELDYIFQFGLGWEW